MSVSSDTKLIDLSGLKTAIDLIFDAFTTRTAKHIASIEATASDTVIFKCVDGSTAFTLSEGGETYEHPTYTTRTGKPTSNQTPSFGDAITVSAATVDSLGHVSDLTDRTITMPSATATTLASGLMSSADKIKLNGIASGAQVNSVTGVKGNAETNYRTGNINLTAANIGAAVSDHTHSTYAATTHSHATVTSSAAGFMSSADKSKLDGIATSANNYAHPTQTAITGVPTANQTPNFGGTFSVSQPAVNTLGHVTALTTRTITIPALPTASSSTLGCVKVGSGLAISNDVLSVSLSELILPSTASNTDRAIWIA